MEITDVRITLPSVGDKPQVLAYVRIEFDRCFVVNDIRYIMGNSGRAFVSMPSRKMTDRCRSCNKKNTLDACFCTHCGVEEPHEKLENDEQLYEDVAYPFSAEFRHKLEMAVLRAYKEASEINANASRKIPADADTTNIRNEATPRPSPLFQAEDPSRVS